MSFAHAVRPPVVPATPINVLLVDAEDVVAQYAPVLSATYHVVTASSAVMASTLLSRNTPELVVTDLQLPDGHGLDVCRSAKSLSTPPFVLVTTIEVGRVPDALDTGCEGVLLKPFQPNLLLARVSRLLRERATKRMLERAGVRRQALEGSVMTGTNRVFPHLECPFCAERGITSFDHSSMRRAWFACRACRNVWLAKRQEDQHASNRSVLMSAVSGRR